nr:hypothetical protein [Streptomyces sp. V1I1]
MAIGLRCPVQVDIGLEKPAETVRGLMVPRIAIQDTPELDLGFGVLARIGQADAERVARGDIVGLPLEKFLQQRHRFLRPAPLMEITRSLVQRPVHPVS